MTSTQDLLPQSLDVGKTFGALFIAVTLAAMLVNTLLAIHSKLTFFDISRNSLFGITNVQAFIYFQTHRDTGMTLYKWIVCSRRLLFNPTP